MKLVNDDSIEQISMSLFLNLPSALYSSEPVIQKS